MTVVHGSEQSLGLFLQQARESQGLSVEVVSDRLKFTVRQVQALESGAYGQLSGRTFVRGFVRSHARLLGLPEAYLLLRLEAELPVEAPVIHLPPLRHAVIPSTRKSYSLLKYVLIVPIVFAMAWFAYRWIQQSHITQAPVPENQLLLESDLPAPVAEASSPVASAFVASTTSASQNVTVPSGAGLVFKLNGSSWIEVLDAKGKVLFAAVAEKDTPIPLNGEPPFRLKVGKASAVSVFYAGKPVDLKPYTRGEVARITLP